MSKCFNCGKKAEYHIEIEWNNKVLSEEDGEYAGFDLCYDCYESVIFLEQLNKFDALEWLSFYYANPEETNNEQ